MASATADETIQFQPGISDAEQEARMPRTRANGKICYVGIPAGDIARSADSYKAVFGWNIRQRGAGAAALEDGVGAVSCAWVLVRPSSAKPGLLVYIMVD